MPRWHRPESGAWNGVSLGGWLLLEPGASEPLFDNHAYKNGEVPSCEWDLMLSLRRQNAVQVVHQHRRTHITRHDFKRIRACGLNAVRLPFGYWCVLGPTGGDPYEGPCLEIIDQALDWAEEFGLQVVLDLHGQPGGENPNPPCGRTQSNAGADWGVTGCSNYTWHWRQWRVGQSLRALQVLALRYKDRKCVTGIAVCNEPSASIPMGHLLRYYDKAVTLVRKCGMGAKQVAVVLPIYQRDYPVFVKEWSSITQGRHRNICFEDHFYHCFEHFHGFTFAQQLRAVQENARELKRYPMVVGEWSLALGRTSFNTSISAEELRKQFGRVQIEAYKAASHGWFFWTWKDGHGEEWVYPECFKKGCFSGPAPVLNAWNGKGEDPLEDKFNPIVGDPQICFGDPIFLRGFFGCYLDAEKCKVHAQWPDTGEWQRFTLLPPLGAPQKRRQIFHGDVVRICSHTKRFLFEAEDGQLSADKRLTTADPNGLSEFIVRTLDKKPLRSHKTLFFQSRATSHMIDTCDDDDVVRGRWNSFGDWQRWVIEKDQETPQSLDLGLAPQLAKLAPSKGSKRKLSMKRANSHTKAKKRRLSRD